MTVNKNLIARKNEYIKSKNPNKIYINKFMMIIEKIEKKIPMKYFK